MTLPKPYLSWSAVECWRKSKPEYRRRYYENLPQTWNSPEMLFGRDIGQLLENNDPSLSHIPRGTHPEYRILTDILDVPVLCYLDSFTPETKTILEYKTSRVGWDQARVDNHGQLLMYASAVRSKLGDYDPNVTLVWLETRQETRDVVVSGFTMQVPSIALTGRVETFTRHIEPVELDTFGKELSDLAHEISNDYAEWTSR